MREIFADRKGEVDDYDRKALAAITNSLTRMRSSLALLSGKADALSPLSVLSRGYGIVEKDGKNVKGIDCLSVGDEVKISLSKGKLNASVTEIYEVEK